MAKNILEEIVNRRKEDIAKLGLEFGFEIPAKRLRPVHPFITEKGVILEVKRASPSKGDIAPDLDSFATAMDYAKAGAKAISCLTETNYFKGTLQDLMKVCTAVDSYEKETGKTGPAVLRKDFLISPEEVEIAYRAGADAVLLISRILDVETMTVMAKKCQELGISALVELRLQEDVDKLGEVLKSVDKKYIVAGVNSRDLKDFSIDLLKPCSMKAKICKVMGDDARIIFESGIRTPESARFVGSLGFAGMLLGEAAAKNPEIRTSLVESFTKATETPNAAFWNKYSETIDNIPKVKICGITRKEDGIFSKDSGADFLGFIFFHKSPRCGSEEVVRELYNELKDNKKPIFVGVIVDPDLPESKIAINLVKEGILDVLQLHTINGARKFLADKDLCTLPHFAAINISTPEDVKLLDELFDQGEPRILVDAQVGDKIGGTGKQISPELVELIQKKYKLWLAGGVTPANINSINNKLSPELCDCASGVEESPGVKDFNKIKELFYDIR